MERCYAAIVGAPPTLFGSASAVMLLRFVLAHLGSTATARRRAAASRRPPTAGGSRATCTRRLLCGGAVLGAREQEFELIVDTGSALTAMPCSSCAHRGHKAGAKFNPALVDVEGAQCASPPSGMHCSNCANGDCGYSVSYTEGSSIRGRMVETVFFVQRPRQGARVVRLPDVRDRPLQQAGGRRHHRLLAVRSQADAPGSDPQPARRARHLLALPERHDGRDGLGGRLDGGAAEPAWVRTSPGAASYEVAVEQFLVDGAAAPGSSSQYRGTIVDSGTTFTYLPPSAYAKAKERRRSPPGGRPWGECSKRARRASTPTTTATR